MSHDSNDSGVSGHPSGVPASRLEALLASLNRSRELGFLGPGPVEAHISNASAFISECGPTDRILDLGSGGGVPGLVLAVALPDAHVVLLDAMSKRCEFLAEEVDHLGVDADVVHGRAEVMARRDDLRRSFDVVVARSFGPPSVTAECAVGFLDDGGRLLVSEPPEGAPDRWEITGLAELGLLPPRYLSVEGTSLAVMHQEGTLDDRWPRRDGLPGKRPLWR